MKNFINKTYINREFSWLKFNERVLAEATAPDNPLLEKCKFLSIFSSNLDEFCMVRIGSLLNASGSSKILDNKTGLTPAEQLSGVYSMLQKYYTMRANTAQKIFSELKQEGIIFKTVHAKNTKVGKRFSKYYKNTLLPLVNPIVLDNKHPLIHFENCKLYVVLQLENNGKNFFGVLPMPAKCDRLVAEPTANGTKIMTAEDLLYTFADDVFPHYKILGKTLVRITRNADFDYDAYSVDFESEFDFSRVLKAKVDGRVNLAPVRLELSNDNKAITEFLCKQLNLSQKQCFRVRYYFDYRFLFGLEKFLSEENSARLKFPSYRGRVQSLSDSASVIASVRQKDLFLSYPFDSMSPFLDLLDEASSDPRVADIKITLYRVDKQSRVVEALRRACRNGKDVTVLIELTARFDEENNLHIARILQDAGCSVGYGFGNYKVHSKICLIVLKEGEEISYITHLGTGNYNEETSKLYTDLNIITADKAIGEDAIDFFRNLSTGNTEPVYQKLLVAPFSLKNSFLNKIGHQIELAEAGKPAAITCKLNSLTDLSFINEFIRASQAGVTVKLIIRGICCLLPGINNKTDNIKVKSIIGRFLEHSRIYAFGVGGKQEIFISSADLMTRNVERRVEIATPILDASIRKRIVKMLDILWADNEKAWYLDENGNYVRNKNTGVSSQQYFMDRKV